MSGEAISSINRTPSFLANLEQLSAQKKSWLQLPAYLYATDDGDLTEVGLFYKIIETFREKILGCKNRTSREVVGSRVLTILKTNKRQIDAQKLRLITQVAEQKKLMGDSVFAGAFNERSIKILNKITQLNTKEMHEKAEPEPAIIDDPVFETELSNRDALQQDGSGEE